MTLHAELGRSFPSQKRLSVLTEECGHEENSIVNLPPGTYVVAFSLTGFNTLRHDRIEVAISE